MRDWIVNIEPIRINIQHLPFSSIVQLKYRPNIACKNTHLRLLSSMDKVSSFHLCVNINGQGLVHWDLLHIAKWAIYSWCGPIIVCKYNYIGLLGIALFGL